MSPEARAQRLEALRGQMRETGVGLTAVAPTDNMRYLLGFALHPDERACLLLVSDGREALLVPGLNAEAAAAQAPELELVPWADEAGPDVALRTALGRLGDGTHRAAVDAEMRADHLLLLQAALPGAETIPAGRVIDPLRETKDAGELTLLQRSAAVADEAMRTAFATLAVGVTELAVAEALASTFRAGGSLPEFGIVGGGPHGAFPHHETGTRPLQEGDAVVIDIGGRREGYYSDITRMAFIGTPTDRYREVHAIVEAAVRAGIAAAGPGVTCGEVDAAARGVITDAGYGEYFVHRTGHGLGLSIHEPPWVMDGSEAVLRVGVVHSIEPGIYLPGEFGVRLEEIVQVTATGAQRFSALPRDVHVIAG